MAVLDIAGVAREVLGVVWPPESCPFDFIDTEEGPLREEYHKARRENRRWRFKIAGAIMALVGVLIWLNLLRDQLLDLLGSGPRADHEGGSAAQGGGERDQGSGTQADGGKRPADDRHHRAIGGT